MEKKLEKSITQSKQKIFCAWPAKEKEHEGKTCTYLCSFVGKEFNSWIGSDTGFLACLSIGLTVYFSSFHFSFNHLKKDKYDLIILFGIKYFSNHKAM